ncbi:hypothetical protein MmTuc01_2762 [Methanosarcina mazei Tuc01]|uniref:Uncharacterized protein n=1 Tax=Methanosarcina mazei Tuc01 TaxID=1236903 RepID=M1Q6V9_METMZ|nr:hypothetical protein MmTuc01_2762 [Methanosarcina mazei Tuc01]
MPEMGLGQVMLTGMESLLKLFRKLNCFRRKIRKKIKMRI